MKKFKIPSNLAVSESGFLFAASTGETFTLNPVALEIIKRIQNGEDEDSIINHFLTNYEVDKDLIEKDLSDFISSLKSFNLVEEL